MALISHASKVMPKILQAIFNSTWTENFQMYKLRLEKAAEPDIKLLTFVGSERKQENSEKHLLLLHWLYESYWLCESQQTVKNS